MLGTFGSVIVATVHVLLPFMMLPIASALQSLDTVLERAAQRAVQRDHRRLGREHVDHVKIETALEEGLEPPLVSRRIQEIGDEHGHPRLPRAQGIVRQAFAEPGESGGPEA